MTKDERLKRLLDSIDALDEAEKALAGHPKLKELSLKLTKVNLLLFELTEKVKADRRAGPLNNPLTAKRVVQAMSEAAKARWSDRGTFFEVTWRASGERRILESYDSVGHVLNLKTSSVRVMLSNYNGTLIRRVDDDIITVVRKFRQAGDKPNFSLPVTDASSSTPHPTSHPTKKTGPRTRQKPPDASKRPAPRRAKG